MNGTSNALVDGIEPPAFAHTNTCRGPRFTWRIGREGDRLWKCHGCGRFKVEQTTNEPAPADVPEAKPSRGYVCRPHYADVTWQGSGCTTCDAELSMTKSARRRRRRNELEANREL
ncbi:hypothetical protein GCM10027039_01770 [Terrabacter koreensis]